MISLAEEKTPQHFNANAIMLHISLEHSNPITYYTTQHMSEWLRALVREPMQVDLLVVRDRVLQHGTFKLRLVLRRPSDIIFEFLLWPLCSFQLIIVGWPRFQSPV